jgi:fatty acid desaturase
MRKLTFRDLLATLIVAAVVVPFVGYSVRGSMPFVQDPRGMAGVGIVGALLAFAAFGRKGFGTGTFETVMVTLAIVTIGFAVAALIAETMWWLLVPMVAGLVLMWALALMHDAGYVAPTHAAGHA